MAPATAPHASTAASAQTVLPFTGLESPHDVAVDTAGNVYVADTHDFTTTRDFPDGTSQVIKLPAGSTPKHDCRSSPMPLWRWTRKEESGSATSSW